MSTYDALMKGVFRPEDANATVSAASLKGLTYEMNLAATIAFESITDDEGVDEIKNRFKEVFSEMNSSELDNEIKEILSRFESEGLIEPNEKK